MQPTDEIRDLEARLRVFHTILAALRTDQQQPQRIDDAIGRHLDQIQYHQGEIDKLVYRRNNIDALMDDVKSNLRAMSKQLNLLRNRNAIARLLRLRDELEILGGHVLDKQEVIE